MDLLNSSEPQTLWGMKRKSSKPIEELEGDIKVLQERIDQLEKDLHNVLQHKISINDLDEDEDPFLSDHESSSFLNDSFPSRAKSGKYSAQTDIAYLYSVPLVMEHRSKIRSMGLPIDHNAEIDDIIGKILQHP